jgi:hypothetical protein
MCDKSANFWMRPAHCGAQGALVGKVAMYLQVRPRIMAGKNPPFSFFM